MLLAPTCNFLGSPVIEEVIAAIKQDLAGFKHKSKELAAFYWHDFGSTVLTKAGVVHHVRLAYGDTSEPRIFQFLRLNAIGYKIFSSAVDNAISIMGG